MNNDNTFSWQGYQPEETSHRLVAAYLAVDIQRNIEETNNLLQKIDAISKREIPNWERIGNAYYLRLFPEYAEIEEEFSDGTDQPERIPLSLFRTAVQSWQRHISSS
ncbi:hypothetical protein W03_06550 [Nitrosomonas sp. PY1]|uniref:hypothetical protein n=1 Tax=Nitrosomonas sp. PY1 TaxID=1803906 RepID=UPI001FC7F94E|nr:hypothetical protein [Nitrosomonas sp. PY1]GKS68651.1 hypothetical protein W03_06550 [Nitrosomonas sp. PY1]